MGTYAYDKANTRLIALKLNHKTDADILKHIEELDNIQGYIKALIRADIAAQGKTEPAPTDSPAE